MSYGYLYGVATNGVLCFLNALSAAYLLKLYGSALAAENVRSGTESRLHNAAGCAEDCDCAAGVAEGLIVIGIFKAYEVDTCFLYHFCKLAGG